MKERIKSALINFGFKHYWHCLQGCVFLAWMWLGMHWSEAYPGWLKLAQFIGCAIVGTAGGFFTKQELSTRKDRKVITKADEHFQQVEKMAREMLDTALATRESLVQQKADLVADINELVEYHRAIAEGPSEEQMIEALSESPQEQLFQEVKGIRLFRLFGKEELLRIVGRRTLKEYGLEVPKRFATCILIAKDNSSFRAEVVIPDETITA